MELNGFIGEEKINDLFFSHQITDQQYVKHHSQEMLDAYNGYLQDNGLEDSEESAAKYLDEDDSVAMLEMEEENEMEEETPAISQSSIEVYEKWKQDVEMTNSLLADNTTAAKIALWRYKNPTSDDKHLCAEETETDDATVEKWWLAIDLRVHRWHIFQAGFTNITEHGNADFQCHDRYFGVIILFLL